MAVRWLQELVGSGKDDEVLDDLAEFLRSRQGQGGIIYARCALSVCPIYSHCKNATMVNYGIMT